MFPSTNPLSRDPGSISGPWLSFMPPATRPPRPASGKPLAKDRRIEIRMPLFEMNHEPLHHVPRQRTRYKGEPRSFYLFFLALSIVGKLQLVADNDLPGELTMAY